MLRVLSYDRPERAIIGLVEEEAPTPWVLSPSARIVRVPSRPLKYRNADFDSLYDSETISYDCFWAKPSAKVVLLGPPLLNLKDLLVRMRVVAIPDGRNCTFSARHLDRHSQFWIDAPSGTQSLAIKSGPASIRLPIGINKSELFSGKRVILTLSKNNSLRWIRDWISYHRDVHGANAVLFYDNASTDYTISDLKTCLLGIAGIDRTCIVQWPFKYGPQGIPGKYWDSDYCQAGVLEHARWRFLQTARSVLQVDIDELVVSRDRSIFELAESARNGYVSFWGRWVIGTKDNDEKLISRTQNAELIRHRDFQHSLKTEMQWKLSGPVNVNRCPTKWAIVPSRCPPLSQWKAHRVTRFLPMPLSATKASYRHFREINTSWKYDRSDREYFNSSKHQLDAELLSAYSRVRWSV